MVPSSKHKSKTRFFCSKQHKDYFILIEQKMNSSHLASEHVIYTVSFVFCLNEILSDSSNLTFLNSLQSSAAVRSSDWLKIEASNWSRIDCVFVTFVTLLSNYNYYVIGRLRNGDLFTRGMIHYV